MSLALLSIAIFIILLTKVIISLLTFIISTVLSEKDFNICSTILSNVKYFSIIKPLFNNINLIVSIVFGLLLSAKQTFILLPTISNGIALYFSAISKEIYSKKSILISVVLKSIDFSPNISPIASINFCGSHIFKIYNISPIFFSGFSF